MESTLDRTGSTLEWLRSYSCDLSLRVQIEYSFSASQEILWSVPQRPVLCPLLFLIYLLPLGILIRNHVLKLHAYEDNPQLNMSVEPINQRAVDIRVAKLENCLTDISISPHHRKSYDLYHRDKCLTSFSI